MLLFFVLAFLAIANGHPQYCPTVNDLTVGYGPASVTLRNQGWTVSGANGGGAVATKAAFDIIGGEVEYDVDFTNTKIGVNANIYTISPTFGSRAFNKDSDYCDGQGVPQYCIEIDWIESNGACGAATTLHTRPGPGENGCTAWGCSKKYNYNGRASFHMKIVHAVDGTMIVYRDGVAITHADYVPAIQSFDLQEMKDVFQTKGALIYSSIWTGWVATIPGCSTTPGDLASSSFTVSNLKVTGTVVQGPTPTLCNNGPVAPTPPVAPVPITPPPVVASAPIITSIAVANSRVPQTGSFQVTVGYQAFEPNSWIVVDILNSNGWSFHGTGTDSVNTGTGTKVITVTVETTIPVVSTIQLKAWIVKSANKGNWQAASGTATQIISVSVGSSPVPVPTAAPTAVPTSAPSAAPTSAPTAAPTNAPVASPTSAPSAAPTTAPVAQPLESSNCVATIQQNADGYWFSLLVTPGGTPGITCADPNVRANCANAGYTVDSKTVWQCPSGGRCVPTAITCSKSGARLSEDETQSSAGLAGWAIGLIVLAVVFTILLVVAVGLFLTRGSARAESF